MQNIRITTSPIEIQFDFFFFFYLKNIFLLTGTREELMNIEVRRRSECKNMVSKNLHQISLVSPSPAIELFLMSRARSVQILESHFRFLISVSQSQNSRKVGNLPLVTDLLTDLKTLLMCKSHLILRLKPLIGGPNRISSMWATEESGWDLFYLSNTLKRRNLGKPT